MNREIKFRIWYYDQKKFDYNVGLEDFKKYSFPLYWCCVQQYTGLQDSTGKEIYEGDILAYEEGNFLKGENGLDDRLEIFWDAENAKFGINFYSKYGGEGYTGKGEHLSSYSKKTKIIGNIFETPELLQ